jgi:hypothetical protein
MNKNKQQVRNTFGIISESGHLLRDIIGASMQTSILSRAYIHQGYIYLGNVKYTLLIDKKLEDAFQYDDHILCVISFQRRIGGNYAVARLHNKSPLNEILLTK